MALVRWEPARELQSIQSEMNRVFNTFFDTPTGGVSNGTQGGRRWIPAMDLVETDDQFVLRADLPGLDQGDVTLEVQDDVLTLSGERRSEQEAKGDGYYRLERATGAFSRSLTLPDGVDAEAITASFDKGVLEVRIPKPEQKRPRRVAIAVGEERPAIEGSETAQQP